MAIAYGSKEFLAPTSPARKVSVFSDQARQAILGAYRPSYYTAVGAISATLVKFERLHNGLLGAVYEIRIHNPYTGKMEVGRYLWGVDKTGGPVEVKRFPAKAY